MTTKSNKLERLSLAPPLRSRLEAGQVEHVIISRVGSWPYFQISDLPLKLISTLLLVTQ
jgi:hypothetical protein